ncbi:MAG: T9SS type A sorting domain-containing protein [Bacteroidaceae bacterium]|nr:T9SS type A sorting domain-containing protein [Bacteroidaceae bacterium]
MEKLKKIFMVLSLVFILIGFGASVWLYMVLKDTTSIVMMSVFFVALIWYGFNVKRLFLPLLLLFSLGASAKSVVFTLNSGEKVYYLLSKDVNPMLRFKDGKMTVNDDAYEFSDIKNFYISDEDDPNAIEQVLSNQKMTFRSNTLVLRSDAVKTLKVYTLDGVEVKVQVQKTDDVISVDLNGLEKGVYLISTGNSSIKVWKK